MSGSNRSQTQPKFVAHVYEGDCQAIKELVQQYPNIETGGDLFGLWQDESTVVIQLFIGPGEKCDRTAASFHQDIDYLHKVGSLITTEDGLCNVGEWHSHHQIGMPGPSQNDCRTVFSNMPQLGLERFVLFIASIETKAAGRKSHKRPLDVKLEEIKLRPFLFLSHKGKEKYFEGKIKIIPGENPHIENSRARREIEKGAAQPPPDLEAPKFSRKTKPIAGGDNSFDDHEDDENKSPNKEHGYYRKTNPPTTHPGDIKKITRPGNQGGSTRPELAQGKGRDASMPQRMDTTSQATATQQRRHDPQSFGGHTQSFQGRQDAQSTRQGHQGDQDCRQRSTQHQTHAGPHTSQRQEGGAIGENVCVGPMNANGFF